MLSIRAILIESLLASWNHEVDHKLTLSSSIGYDERHKYEFDMRKSIALFLTLSLTALSMNLHAREERGVDLIIMTLDGQEIKGELITVKKNALLLLGNESEADVSVEVADIKEIRIVKKEHFWRGAGLGYLAGGAGTLLLGAVSGELNDWALSLWIFVIGPACSLIGGFWGGLSGIDKRYKIEGKTRLEIQDVLDKLRFKARVPDFQ